MPGRPKTIKVYSKKHNNQQIIINECDFNGTIHSFELKKVEKIEETKPKPRQSKIKSQE